MSTASVPAVPKAKAGAPKKQPTEQQKRILALQDLKAKDKATEAQLSELKTLVIAERKLTLQRLSVARTNKVLGVLKQIANLGAYKPSEKQTKYIFDMIKDGVEAAYAKWDSNKTVKKAEIAFPTE